MEKVPNASFKITDFKISSFSFEEPDGKYNTLDIEFAPSGIYNSSTGLYQLTLGFVTIARKEEIANETADYKVVMKAHFEATFSFEEIIDIKDFPEYFYANSIAISFPYLRSFISTLTLQANVKLIMLPTLNLNSLSLKLKDNTLVI